MSAELVRRALELTNAPPDMPDENLAEIFSPDVVLDMTVRVFNPKVYEGFDGLREFRADVREVWEVLRITETEIVEEGDRVLVLTCVQSRGRGSGIPIETEGAGIWTVTDGRLVHYHLLGEVGRDEAIAAFRGQSGM